MLEETLVQEKKNPIQLAQQIEELINGCLPIIGRNKSVIQKRKGNLKEKVMQLKEMTREIRSLGMSQEQAIFNVLYTGEQLLDE